MVAWYQQNINLFAKVSFLDKLMFTKHLSIMIKSGLPLKEALDTLANHSGSPKLNQILKEVAKEVQNGQSLTKALSKHDQIFDQFYLGMIKIAEESGSLDETLKFLAQHLNQDYALRRKIQGALFYPAIVMSATIVMGGFIALYLLPQLVDFFEVFDQELPLATQVLLWVANLFKNFGLFIVIGTIGLVSTVVALGQSRLFKPKLHRYLLSMPLIGAITINGQLARFCRNLGTLLKNGVPSSRAFAITSQTLSNLYYQEKITEINEQLVKGKHFHQAMLNIDGPGFPEIIRRMVEVGEKTGSLDQVLLYLGDFFDEEVDSVAKNLATILEPILLLIIGLVVAFVAMAIVSPIYELTGTIQR